MLIDRQMEREARDYRKKIAQENIMLARDQKAFQQYLKDEVMPSLVLTLPTHSMTMSFIPNRLCFSSTQINQQRHSSINSILALVRPRGILRTDFDYRFLAISFSSEDMFVHAVNALSKSGYNAVIKCVCLNEI